MALDTLRQGTGAAAIAATVVLMAGCLTRTSSSGFPASDNGQTTEDASATPAPSPHPLLAVIDTGQTVPAQDSRTGVFTEYKAGGEWRIWWACDARSTGPACSYRIDVTGDGTAFTYINGQLSDGGTLQNCDTEVVGQYCYLTYEIIVTSSVTIETNQITFFTTPGATIALDAQLDGTETGTKLFFMQDGELNGGYRGVITDPVMLVPSTP